MKKLIALFGALCVCASVNTVFAEESHTNLSTGYQFTDTAYSPELGMYLAVARDYTASANGQPLPINVFRSTDGVSWTKAYSNGNAYLSANKDSRESVLWWDAAKEFVLATGENIYTSPDGIKWTASKKSNTEQGIIRGNAMIDAVGDHLIVSGGRAVKFVTPEHLHDASMDYHIFDPSNANTYTNAAGVSMPDGEGVVTYLSVSSGKCWFYTEEYGEGTNADLTNVASCGNQFTGTNMVRDCVYYNNTRSWLITDNSKYIYVASADDKTLTNYVVGGIDTVTSVGTDGNVVFVGGQNGELYYTTDADTLSNTTTWNEVAGGTGERNDEIRSITPIEDGKFLMVTSTNIYIIAPTDDGYASYNTSWQGIVKSSGSDTLIVPSEGVLDEEYKFDVTDYMNEPIPNSIDTIELSKSIDGVTFDGSKLSVDSLCRGGKVKIKVTPFLGSAKEFEVEIIAEDYVMFDGTNGIIIPSEGSDTIDISAYIVGTDGNKMDRDVVYEAVQLVDGVTFDAQTGKLTVSSKAEPNEITIKASSKANPTLISTEKIFELDKAYASSIKISNGPTEITVPTLGSSTYTYKAIVKNQADVEMKSAKVTWSVSDYEGVSISDAGVVTVNKDAYSGTAIIKATASDNDAVYDELEVKFVVTSHVNMLKNGDVEQGTLDGFEGDSINVVSTNQHGGKYALRADGCSICVPTKYELKRDEVYYVSAYAMADDDSICMSSAKSSMKVNGKTQGKYIKLVGNLRPTSSTDAETITFSSSALLPFYIDDVRLFEITEEYNSAAKLVTNAEASKKQTDVDKAKASCDNIIDCPAKDELLARLDKINVGSKSASQSGKSSGGGGGGGGGGQSSSAAVTPATAVQTITTPADNTDNSQKVEYNNLKFKDMYGHWAENEVQALAEMNVISGREDGTFDPDANITRAEFSVLVCKALGLSETAYENDFFDITTEDWCSGWVGAARDANIINGSDGMFYPDNNITREEMAKMVVGAYVNKTKKTIATGDAIYFRDTTKISSWAWDYIQNAVDLGLMSGKDEYTFAPKDNATRAEAAVVLKRLLDLIG